MDVMVTARAIGLFDENGADSYGTIERGQHVVTLDRAVGVGTTLIEQSDRSGRDHDVHVGILPLFGECSNFGTPDCVPVDGGNRRVRVNIA